MPFQKGQRTRSGTKSIHYLATCNIIQKRLISDYMHVRSWGEVGALYEISGGLAYMIAVEGYEPKKKELREKLGFPILIKVAMVSSGNVPNGTQVLEVRLCNRCNKPFVPNCPSRRLCYLCAPKR